jgi:type I restriction enzyme S subunit
MIANLKPYPDYRPSSQAWLGDVPGHWSVIPNRALFAEVKDRNHPNEEMLSVTITRGIVPQRALLDSSSKKDSSNLNKSAYKLVQPRDIAYNKMRAWQGAIGASALRGIISPAYVVMRLRADDDMPSYFHHLYRTPQFAKEAERWSYGITSDMWSLRPEHFKMIYTPQPPPNEQAGIVRFLGWANGKLERAIQAKRKVIALLNEQKQAILQRTITSDFIESLPLSILRLPKEVRTVPEWQSYSVRRLIQLRILEIQDGNHGELHPKASDYVDDGIPFLMANNVRPEGLDLSKCAKLREQQARKLRIGFAYPGDVLMTHKATIGQIGLVPEDLKAPFVMLTPQVTYYRSAGTQFSGNYLFLYMQTPLFQDQLKVLSLNQSTRPYIGIIEQKNLIICFPSLDRQSQICANFERSVAPVESARHRANREIELLREYRTRLVSDVVTGKLDVRDAAAGLPHEFAPECAGDDAELEINPEATDDEEVAV